MNRRSFLTRIVGAAVTAAVAPTILPAATTYVRRWKRQGTLLVPFWKQTIRYSRIVTPDYEAAMQKLFVESFFFGKPLPSALRTYGDLAPIVTVRDTRLEDYRKKLGGTWA